VAGERRGDDGRAAGEPEGYADGSAKPAPTVISVVGARTHNLRDVSVDIRLDQCTLVVGPSGSGKSSLAFGTVHAAAHAAYLEGISSYSRFTETRLTTPDVDAIHRLRPTIALAQGYGGRSSRSTVGTVTDALSLLRLLFSRLGQPERSASKLSFLNPDAVCEVCKGAGTTLTPVVARLLDLERTLREGAMLHRAWKVGGRYWNILEATGELPLDVKTANLSEAQLDFLLRSPSFEVTNRNPGFVQRFTYEGIIPRLEKRVADARDLGSRSYDLSFFDQQPCPACHGTRLCEAARSVAIDGLRFEDVLNHELGELIGFLETLGQPVAAPIRTRLVGLLRRMIDMGLGHLTLLRSTATLSGGELRRVRISHQLISPLSGLVYVVDEAGAGLHHEEARAVYESLAHLSRQGNTVLLVDHSDGARAIADQVIELGPGGGREGCKLIWSGSIDSYQGRYGLLPDIGRTRRPVPDRAPRFTVWARSHNLHPRQVEIPKNRFVVLVGPSGSGKSSLAVDIAAQLPGSTLLSQRDIGGSVRSVIATYLKIFDPIRKLFGQASGRPAGDFSFNGAGACPTCGGWGYLRMDMQFLEDVTTVCEECRGGRYRPELLATRVDGLSIAEVLNLTIDEAVAAFGRYPAIRAPLRTAAATGIGHLVIGQSTDTLSGGEAQRLRISTEVAQPRHTVLLMDEPTRGLGYDEVPRFIALVDLVLDEGRSVIAIEHNLAVIAAADWIIEVGPGSGHQGGRIVAEGVAEDVTSADTLTGRSLAKQAVIR
jgi:excinuclease UvrABC ATPase subunit